MAKDEVDIPTGAREMRRYLSDYLRETELRVSDLNSLDIEPFVFNNSTGDDFENVHIGIRDGEAIIALFEYSFRYRSRRPSFNKLFFRKSTDWFEIFRVKFEEALEPHVKAKKDKEKKEKEEKEAKEKEDKEKEAREDARLQEIIREIAVETAAERMNNED